MSGQDATEGGRGAGGRAGPALRWTLATLALLGLALLWRAVPASAWVDREVVPRVERAGAWGYVGFALVYAAGVVLMAPGSALTLASGYLFGPVAGAALAAASATLGASAAFLVARGVARGAVRRRVEGDRRFRAVDRAVSARGGRVVLLLRLSPIVPFNVLNYALGLTGVRFGAYALASFAGMLPGSAAYAFIGASAGDRRPGELGWGWWAFLVASTLLAVAVLSRIASLALADAEVDADADAEVGGRSGPSPPTPTPTPTPTSSAPDHPRSDRSPPP
ncbi:TVP38/TMEM64 family protein [Tautonia plasticadhaerens]|uniref:TVP38/TMEM64 family membrane protein n=1 Tax=Tautonia plasticadhaerens TaxID=2527974 RepID=A0A518H322_9BACT|nr:TVP38/TMEM64 family protein [Tautonia plasticadhaerens]QDV35236.1 TVP38/TMEM64 family inner membrane protein YdjZ [Tautonia plasticadhaerens]